jgi:glycoside/pentoside/hexuronide:cation symporter, GPH family
VQTNTGKLSVREKIGYSLGDASANFVFMTMILFQSKFYTDTFGLEASIAGTLLLVGRLWDAFFDPMMGTIADRTNTRWGRFRPWVLWTALPWGVAMVLAYTTPNFTLTGMIVYAISTNILLMTLYSANNTPYSAMLGVMTGDGKERTSLSSYRFVAAMVAQLAVGGFTLPLVAKFGQGDNAKGWQMTLGLWAIISIVFFVITFLSTRERIQPDPRQKSSPKEDFRGLLKTGPWVAMFILTLSHFIFVAMRGGATAYYFDYYIDKNAMLHFLESLGLAGVGSTGGGVGHYLMDTFGLIVNPDKTNVSSVGFSVFTMFSQLVLVIGVICSPFLASRFGKKAVALTGFTFSTIFLTLFIFLPSDSIVATFVLEFFRALAYAPTIPLLWAMFADVADYIEWKSSRRITGVVFATVLFALKAGLSLGGAIGLWILSGFGYQPNTIQTPGALLGIRMSISVFPAICLGIVIVCLIFYTLGRKMNLQIQNELAERRKSYEAE